MSPTVVLHAAAEAAIVASVAAAAPRELVAAVGGRRDAGTWLVDSIVPLPNVAARDDCFEVPPAAFAAAEAQLRASGHTWLGFVHSHPRGCASPSLADRALLWRGCLQLIAAGDCRGPGALRAFVLRGDTDVVVLPLQLLVAAVERA